MLFRGREAHSGSAEQKRVPCICRRLSDKKEGGFSATFIWNGTADKDVDPANSRLLAAALKHAGIVHRAEEYEGIGHGVGLAKGTDAEVWFDHAVEFWQMNR